MKPLVFISYRRSDSQQAALGLHSQLRERFGPTSVFMDRSGISAGEVWPQRLSEAVQNATVVLALIGPGWLKAADEYGRRRLDMAGDWVRNELLGAIQAGKPVIPVLLSPLTNLPAGEALPAELQPLLQYQAYSLRDEQWDADLTSLVKLLVHEHSCKETERDVRLPDPEVRIKALTDAELEEELRSLPGWEPVESFTPGNYPKSRQELRKIYVFKSFRSAVEFMHAATVPINRVKHHPRWENQWRSVKVHLSTWDIGFRISQLDIDVARMLDAVYADQSGKPPVSAAGA